MNSTSYDGAESSDEDLAFSEFLSVVWQGKWVLIGMSVLGLVVGLGSTLLVSKKYEAFVLVSPVSAGEGGGFGRGGGLSGLGSLGGLAALAGVNLGTDTTKAESLAVLESASLTEEYIRDQNLMPVLFSDQWDSTRRTWKTQAGRKEPTLWTANRFFAKKVRSITTDSKTGLVTVSMTWLDPVKAAEWANGIVALANSSLRSRAISDSQRNIDYLNEQAAKTNVLEVRQAIFSVLTTEINKQMLARGTSEYAFKVIDVARPPERHSSPKRKVWALMGVVGGCFCGGVAILLRAAFGRRRAVASA